MAGAGRGRREGPQPKTERVVVIGHFGCAHASFAAKGFEFAQGTAKGSGVRAMGEEEVELIAACRDTLAPQSDVFDGRLGWLLGQGEGDEA